MSLLVNLLAWALSLIAPETFEAMATGNGAMLGLVLLPVAMLIDAGIQFVLGNTLGKKIAGIRLETYTHERLILQTCIFRNLDVYIKGMGLGIPVVSLFTYMNAYGKLSSGKMVSWDERLFTRVFNINANIYRTTALAAAFFSFAAYRVWSLQAA